MKTQIRIALLISFIAAVVFTSCRTEEMEFVEAPPEETLIPNSLVASLMMQTTLNDGSNDNIIDNANCFNIQLPVTVIVNGVEITVTSEDDYDAIEYIFGTSEALSCCILSRGRAEAWGLCLLLFI